MTITGNSFVNASTGFNFFGTGPSTFSIANNTFTGATNIGFNLT